MHSSRNLIVNVSCYHHLTFSYALLASDRPIDQLADGQTVIGNLHFQKDNKLLHKLCTFLELKAGMFELVLMLLAMFLALSRAFSMDPYTKILVEA